MYINELVTQLPLYKFVDDSTVFEICNTNEVSVIQESLDVAVEWTVNNDMEINPAKSRDDYVFQKMQILGIMFQMWLWKEI